MTLAKRQAQFLDHAMKQGWLGFMPSTANPTAQADPVTGLYKVARFTGELRTETPGEIQVGVLDHTYFDNSRRPCNQLWLQVATLCKAPQLYLMLPKRPPAFAPDAPAPPGPEKADGLPAAPNDAFGEMNSTANLAALGNVTDRLLTHSQVQASVQSELIKVVREMVVATRDLTAAMELNAQAIADQGRPPMRRRPLAAVDTPGESVPEEHAG